MVRTQVQRRKVRQPTKAAGERLGHRIVLIRDGKLVQGAQSAAAKDRGAVCR